MQPCRMKSIDPTIFVLAEMMFRLFVQRMQSGCAI